MMDIDEYNKYTQIHSDKASLLERIDREWDALNTLVDSLSEEQLTALDPGGWSPLDNLAHLAAWEQFLHSHHIEGQPMHTALGVTKEIAEHGDEDAWNAILLERNRGRSVSDILAWSRAVHQQVMDDLEALSFEDLMKQEDPDTLPLICHVIYNTWEHYIEHREMIEAHFK